MSLGENPRPKRPARPRAPDPFTIQPSRPAPPPPTALQSKTPSPPSEYPITPLYTSVLPAEVITPARPAPPVPRRPVLSREQCFSQSTETEDCTTPQNPLPALRRPPAPPRPVAPLRPGVVQPRRPILSQSLSEQPDEHIYEYIPDVLPDTPEDEGVNGERGVCAAERKPLTPHPLRSLSEQSSVDGDSSAKELDILLEWWRSVEGWEELQMGHRRQEPETKLMLVAQRVKTGMRLYQLLVFQHGKILLNHITELHCTADSLSRVGKNTRIAGITGGTTGAVGVAAVVAGVALAPFTFGASMVAAGIGVGVAAAGGVTGASAAITSKVKSSQVRSKVERILKNYRFHMEDIIECLGFIDMGMEYIRKLSHSRLKHLDPCTLKIVQMAVEMGSFCSTDAIGEYSCILQGFASGLDSYFSEEDKLKLKKGSESQFADNIREVADKLKESMDELIRIKNLFRSIVDHV
ncbi:uncharacterized protein LOC118807888 [Colossoma macropomum]|uniref:uncharacterized protein LOC118807888 n=1 Tax=Colossoma macropomum TaxID=42526 RepID=UPI001864E295|nr:uncharacterized protein LOC118807888 [Colossoma macropomum]